MSTRLHWVPITKLKNPVKESGPSLKNALRDEFGVSGCARVLGCEAMPFMRGLVAAGVPGAHELLEAISEHGEIEVWEEG